jgi:hypothetical protein
MIAAVVTTAAVAAASAFVPAIPIEAYLVAVNTTTGTDPVALGVAAGLGQTAGKLLTFLAARGVIRSSRLRRWLGRRPGRSGSGSADGAPPVQRSTVRAGTEGDLCTCGAGLAVAICRPVSGATARAGFYEVTARSAKTARPNGRGVSVVLPDQTTGRRRIGC